MPIGHYSVLKGHPLSMSEHEKHGAHYIVALTDGSESFSAAINVLSMEGSLVLYAIKEIQSPVEQDKISALPYGMSELEPGDSISMDYVRMRSEGRPVITRAEMSLLPPPDDSEGTTHLAFSNAIEGLLEACERDPNAIILVFGSAFSANGIHDTHMNQGNYGEHARDNGVWQDGMVLLFIDQKWYSIFIAFQTQCWMTDDKGNPAGIYAYAQ